MSINNKIRVTACSDKQGGFGLKSRNYLAIMLIIFAGMTLLTSCTGDNKATQENEMPNEIKADSALFQGVIKSIDTESRQITFLNYNYYNEVVLAYSDATKAYNSVGSLTTPETMEAGSVVQVSYESDTNLIRSIEIDSDSWEYDNVVKWSIDTNKYMLSISDTNYRYNDSVVVLSQGKTQDVMCLNPVDKLKIYGIDNKICSIIVKEGHGYIKPSNYEEFIGGVMSVGYEMNRPIEENMLLAVREGIYEVTMKNGSLSGTKTVQVLRDTQTPLDMSGTAKGAVDEGSVEFDIWPPGADVYVNGKLVDTSENLTLKYGKHSVTASLLGYTSYKGILTVNSPNPTVIINLSEEIAEVDDEDRDNNKDSDEEADNTSKSSTSVSASSDDNKLNNADESQIKYDKDHTITVNKPEGTRVYLNGTYKGVVPCSFPKEIGTHTVTLSKDGETTRSYTIAVEDDSNNIEWSFPELTQE